MDVNYSSPDTPGLNGMTSEDYDAEDLIEYAPELDEQQEATKVSAADTLHALCVDIFDNEFLDDENADATNGFEYNVDSNNKIRDALEGVRQYENNQNEANQIVEDRMQYMEDEGSQQEEINRERYEKPVRIRKPQVNRRPLNPEEWKINKRKMSRNSGLEYVGKGGKSVAAKVFLNKPCNCRLNCDAKFTERERKLLFDTFWDLQDFNLQNIRLRGMVEVVDVERHRESNLVRPRFKTFKYYLQPNEHSDPLRVCKRFFLDTFQISHGRIYRCCSKPDLEAVVDHRGKPGDDTEQRRLQKTHVKEHIMQFSLYKEQFLSSSLTIRNMYDLYVQECEAQQQKPLSQEYYYQVVDTILSVKVHKDGRQLQRRRRKALLKRLYSREELTRLVGKMLRMRLPSKILREELKLGNSGN